jgi:hypothetical protein
MVEVRPNVVLYVYGAGLGANPWQPWAGGGTHLQFLEVTSDGLRSVSHATPDRRIAQ